MSKEEVIAGLKSGRKLHWKGRCENLVDGATDEQCKCAGVEMWIIGWIIKRAGIVVRFVGGR